MKNKFLLLASAKRTCSSCLSRVHVNNEGRPKHGVLTWRQPAMRPKRPTAEAKTCTTKILMKRAGFWASANAVADPVILR